tara:strand:+ start:320 stop:541 length:222 start_codon:yes stop_codon:yes gene_type:complete
MDAPAFACTAPRFYVESDDSRARRGAPQEVSAAADDADRMPRMQLHEDESNTLVATAPRRVGLGIAAPAAARA